MKNKILMKIKRTKYSNKKIMAFVIHKIKSIVTRLNVSRESNFNK
jgi:hypothetical protein